MWKDVNDCVEKIEYYLKNKEEREELVKKLRERSLLFTYENQLGKLLKAIKVL